MKTVVVTSEIVRENRSKRGVAIHEAGHFAVARQLGFQMLGLTIRRDNARAEFHSGHAHIVTVCRIANDRDLEEYLRERITVLLAGGLAQAFNGTAVDARRLAEIREDNAGDDMGKARELFVIHLNRRITEGKDSELASSDSWEQHALWQQCEADALRIVQENWSAIERIAADVETKVHRNCLNYDSAAARIIALGWPGDSAATG